MWKEYVKMELGFIESLRRRWDVLGIQIRENVEEEEEYKGEEARRKVMEGGIVESVISSAARGMDGYF